MSNNKLNLLSILDSIEKIEKYSKDFNNPEENFTMIQKVLMLQ